MEHSSERLANTRIVLVQTSHPGNIGGVARAMMNMGLSQLALVRPERFPHAEATARASGATGILSSAMVTNTLEEALAGCVRVYGASARLRAVSCPTLDARTAVGESLGWSQDNPVSFVFGRERSGLTNEELDLCHCQIQIPCNPQFASLNLAAAVQVVAYELRMGAVSPPGELAQGPVPAASDNMERFYAHLEQVLIETEFLDPAVPRFLMRKLRRLYGRAQPDQQELNILRGMLTAAQTAYHPRKT